MADTPPPDITPAQTPESATPPGGGDLLSPAYNAGELHPISAPADQTQPPEQGYISKEMSGIHDWDSYKDTLVQANRDQYNMAGQIVGSDWIIPNVYRGYQGASFKADFNYRIPDEDTKDWHDIFDGIPTELYDRFNDVKSGAQAKFISTRIKAEMQTNATLAKYGPTGTFNRVALNMLDPVGLAVAAGSGGAGASMKVSRIASAVRAGLSGAAANAAITALADTGRYTSDPHDLAWSMVTGFALAAPFGALLRPHEAAALKGALGEEGINQVADEVGSTLKQAGDNSPVVVRPQGAATLSTKLPDTGLPERTNPELRAQLQQQIDEAQASGDPAKIRDAFQAVQKARDTATQEARTDTLTKLPNRRSWDEAVQDPANAGMSVAAVDARKFGDINNVFGEKAGDTAVQHIANVLKEQVGDAGTVYRRGGDEFRVLGPDAELIQQRLQSADAILSDVKLRGKYANGDKAVRHGLGIHFGIGADEDAATAAIVTAKQRGPVGPNAHLHQDGYFTYEAGPRSGGAANPDDTLSAARVDVAASHMSEGEKNIRSDTGAVNVEDKIGQTAFARARFSITAAIRGHTDPWVRNKFGRMFGDSVGSRDRAEVTANGADEIARGIQDIAHTKFSKVADPAYDEWAKAMGYNRFQKLSKATRVEYMRQVGKTIEARDGVALNFHPAVNRTANALRGLFADLLDQAQVSGVKGFEELPQRESYLPHQWDGAEVNRLNTVYGTDRIDDIFTKAFRSANPDVDEKVATMLGKGFHNRIRRLGAGMDNELLSGVGIKDVAYMREVLGEAGADSDTIEYATKQLEASLANRAGEAGVPRHGKHRTEFDVHKQFNVWNDKTQEMDKLSLADMLETNAESLFLRYLHPMSGYIALAKEAGFTSESDFHRAIAELRDRMRADPDGADRLSKKLQSGYDLLIGRSLDADPRSRVNQVLRYIRLYNYPRTMGQVAWSSLTDIGNLLNVGYTRHMLTHIPELGGMLRRSADGKLDGGLANEIEDMFGLGTEFLNNSVYAHGDGLGPMSSQEMMGTQAEHWLRQSGRFSTYASGMAAVQNFIQRLTTHSVVQKFINEAHNPGSGFSEMRLRFLGLDDKMSARVMKQLKTAVDTEPSLWSSRKILRMNYSKFTDYAARDAFITAVRKEARRISQQNDIGGTTPWMHTSLGKSLVQFRNFVIVAHEKQLLHALNMRDPTAFTSIMGSIFMATLAVAGQRSIAGIGKSDEDRAKLLDPADLLKQGIARSTHTAFIPALIDTAVQPFTGGQPVFGYRSSGLANDFLQGNPTVDLVSNLGKAASGLASTAVNPDYKFSQDDLNALWRSTLFQNLWGLTNLHNVMAQDLPKHSLPSNYNNDK